MNSETVEYLRYIALLESNTLIGDYPLLEKVRPAVLGNFFSLEDTLLEAYRAIDEVAYAEFIKDLH